MLLQFHKLKHNTEIHLSPIYQQRFCPMKMLWSHHFPHPRSPGATALVHWVRKRQRTSARDAPRALPRLRGRRAVMAAAATAVWLLLHDHARKASQQRHGDDGVAWRYFAWRAAWLDGPRPGRAPSLARPPGLVVLCGLLPT